MSAEVRTAAGTQRYRPYPDYVDSGVEWLGEIPSTWGVHRNKQIFKEIDDRSESGEETLLSVSEYYGVKPRVEAITEGEFISRAESLIGYKRCQKNDLAMNFMLAWKTGLGFSDYDGIVSPSYAVFRLIREACPRYYHYLLRSSKAVSEFKKRSYGIIDSRLRLYPDVFLTLQSTCPPLSEQRAIAKFLDRETLKIDALVAKKERLIELLQERRTALITQAVTKGLDPNVPMKPSGIDWLGDIPAHWDLKALKRITSRVVVGIAEAATHAYSTKGVPIIRSTNVRDTGFIEGEILYITEEFANQNRSKYLYSSDLVTVRTGYPGTTAVVPPELDRSQCFTLLISTPRKSQDSRFLSYVLNSSGSRIYFDLEGWGTAQTNISVPILQEIPIAVPEREEQEATAGHLDNVTEGLDSLVDRINDGMASLKELRGTLISAAVTGKIDVRNEVQ